MCALYYIYTENYYIISNFFSVCCSILCFVMRNRKNINCTVAESVERFREVCVAAAEKNIPVRAYVAQHTHTHTHTYKLTHTHTHIYADMCRVCLGVHTKATYLQKQWPM